MQTMVPLATFLFVFSILKPGSPSEIRLTQSGEGVRKPGESLQLTCAVSGYTITAGYYWHWPSMKPLEISPDDNDSDLNKCRRQ
ncbi:Ig heavy chain V region M315 [Podarcis lilfordi]|uniref:Ig heavy chain V region M315 n=1 Tax=Podarcis lilfordi TaxID=74358 RepID=A0AA35PJJ0_9SAUR|nr:Ig heavy chain V region M315 [Podarcis lilfordi]